MRDIETSEENGSLAGELLWVQDEAGGGASLVLRIGITHCVNGRWKEVAESSFTGRSELG